MIVMVLNTVVVFLQSCWREEPKSRPGFEHIIADLRALLLRLAAMPRQRSLASTGQLCLSATTIQTAHAFTWTLQIYAVICFAASLTARPIWPAAQAGCLATTKIPGIYRSALP